MEKITDANAFLIEECAPIAAINEFTGKMAEMKVKVAELATCLEKICA